MKLRAAVVLLGLLLAASRSDAGWPKFGSKSTLPEPSNSVKSLGKGNESHKGGKQFRHSQTFRPEWGTIWKQSLRLRDARFGHYLFER